MAPLTYKTLLSERNFLHVAQRARALPNGTNLIGIYYTKNQLIFKTRSASRKGVIWTQIIELTDLAIDNILAAKSFRDVQDLIMNSGLKIACDCEAWLYWGYKYKAWKHGYGLYKENRRPTVRNPHERGFVCFTAGTQVLTSEGYKNIEDIRVGDYVFTHKGRLKPVVATGSRESDTVLLRYGSTWLNTTSEHPFLSSKNISKSCPSTKKFNKSTLKWTEAKDLREGDFLVTPLLKLEHDLIVSNRVAFITGLYAGDGCMQCKSTKSDEATAAFNGYRVKSLSIALDGKYREFYQSLFERLEVNEFKFFSYDQTQSKTFKIYDADLKRACLQYCNFTDSSLNEEKKISPEVLRWNEEAQLEFVRGFFLADGTIVTGAGKKGNYSTYITLFNTNYSIISTLFLILRQWYFLTLDYYDRKPFEEYGHMIYPKRMYYIRLTGAQAEDFYNKLGDLVTVKGWNQESKNFTAYKIGTYDINGVVYTPKIIKEIKRGERQVVYNIEVADDNSYIVEDVVCHNCKHLYLALSTYPFWAKTLASKYLNHFKVNFEQESEQLGQVGDSVKLSNAYGNKPLQ